MLRTNQPNQTSFEQRLAQEAHHVRERAKTLPHGKERELLSRKARQLETASRISEWMSSLELSHRVEQGEASCPSNSIDARHRVYSTAELTKVRRSTCSTPLVPPGPEVITIAKLLVATIAVQERGLAGGHADRIRNRALAKRPAPQFMGGSR